MRPTRRLALALAGASLALGVLALPAGAHTEIAPEQAPAGSDTEFTMTLENERSDAGTVKVEVFFPDGQLIPVLAVPDVGEWTGAPQGGPGGGPGTLGDPAPGITWQRPAGSADDDPELKFTLRLPDRTGTISLAVLQTYSNGDVDRWIEPWPAGAPEPDRPAPRIEVTAASVSSTSSPTTSSTGAPAPSTTAPVEDRESSSTVWIVAAIGGAVLIALLLVLRARRR
ncbi:MAG: DUF1775 domain-containing protein [Actinomycetes bacterium]